ncbi:rhodanese-like domain-containing protein [Calditerricola satsumensis]|uniref:Sulfurtransferase n=1 Tax=Calditerricola satsumensis TaxID=373054 RepID=A0A8J3FBP4_9BACI|nr:rhodanese-like domain-containing protein [Calditerricola satsumensis]GGK02539.1 sulfurtransferase [Calditerricola satsumensis]
MIGGLFGDIPEVTPEEAKELLATGGARYGLLDVRTPEEWARYRIPGAVLIPLDELPARAGELDKGREWIVLCKAGVRSAYACAYLRQLGFRVRNLQGGILAWWEAFGVETG